MKKLLFIIVLLFCTFLAEIIGGLLFGSLSLVSDSLHVLSDMLALFLSYMTFTIAHKKEPSAKMTYGYHRLEVFSALFNGIALIGISFFIIREAIHRFISPSFVSPIPTLAVALIGLIVNIIAALLLRKEAGCTKDLNLRSAFLHILADTLVSVTVIVGMLAIYFTGLYLIDAFVAVAICLFIIASASRILYSGACILLQQSPHDSEMIREKAKSVDGVVDIEDIRLWQVCSNLAIATAHVITSVDKIEETEQIYNELQELLRKEFSVRHLTLHFETPRMAESHSHDFDHKHEHHGHEH